MLFSPDQKLQKKFAAIRKDEVALKAFDLQLEGLTNLLNQQQITLDICPRVRRYLAEAGSSPASATNRMKGFIRNHLCRPVYRMMDSGEVCAGATVRVHLDDAKDLKWEVIRLLKEEVVIPEKRKQNSVNRYPEFDLVHS